jgi:glycosyltransferase involved in cell wall biosynthesis
MGWLVSDCGNKEGIDKINTYDFISSLQMTIFKNMLQKPRSSTFSLTITFTELKEWMRRGNLVRHLFRYREAHFLTHNIEFVPKPFFIALILLLLSPRKSYFEDKQGHRRAVNFHLLATLFRRWIRDYLQKNTLIHQACIEIKQLSNEPLTPQSERTPLDRSGSPVYLRTDLTFGLSSGGSLSHIAGVLNNLDSHLAKPIFLTTDIIPAVRKDLEIHLISPGEEFWDFRELPSIHFNGIFEREAQTHLTGRRLSFIYQRYSINNYSGLKLARFYGVAFVLEYNGSEIWVHRHWERSLRYERLSERIEFLNLRGADLVVVVSQPMKDELVGRGIDRDKILVNPNGVDPERYSPEIDGSHIRAQYSLDGKTVVGFIGTFGKWHGAEILVKAFGRLLQKYPEYQGRVKLFMIGDGITMPLVKENIDKFSIKDSCILTGLIPQEEGPKYLAACDILVASHKPNPDGTPFFGSPTKLFEYMAMGKGIVASDLNQIGEILKHDDTAWLVKPGDVECLNHGLKILIDDEHLRNRLGKAARQEVVTKYTWKEHTRKIIEKLKERCA